MLLHVEQRSGASYWAYFLYDRVCGNNIVWGARNVIHFIIRHIGNADQMVFNKIRVELGRDSSALMPNAW